jgi:GNAT superfamily N-acetyltransferase
MGTDVPNSSPLQPNMGAMVTLHTRDGRQVRVRHMRRDDAELLERMYYRLSSETRYRRCFAPIDNIDGERVHHEACRLATIDPALETALIALTIEDGCDEAVAVARFSRLIVRDDSCEASIVLRDDFQGQSLGRQLFDLLVQTAIASGMRHMALVTHADNVGMISLVQGLGIPFKGRHSAGLYEIDVQLSEVRQPFFPFSGPK